MGKYTWEWRVWTYTKIYITSLHIKWAPSHFHSTQVYLTTYLACTHVFLFPFLLPIIFDVYLSLGNGFLPLIASPILTWLMYLPIMSISETSSLSLPLTQQSSRDLKFDTEVWRQYLLAFLQLRIILGTSNCLQ